MPTLPDVPTARLNRCHAGRCGSSGLRAKDSRCSKLRQYCTTAGPPTHADPAPSIPFSGCATSSLIIGRITIATGHHLWIFQGLLMRMPIRMTTKSPSISAVYLRACTSAIGRLHPLRRLDADQVERPLHHGLRRAAEAEAERLRVAALEDAVLVVEAVEVVGDVDRVVRQLVRAAPLSRLRHDGGELDEPLDELALL